MFYGYSGAPFWYIMFGHGTVLTGLCARFAFLMSAPVMLAAGLTSSLDLLKFQTRNLPALLAVGFVVEPSSLAVINGCLDI